MAKYNSTIDGSSIDTVKKGIISGLLSGLQYIILNTVIGLEFYVSGLFIIHYGVKFGDVIAAFYAIFYAVVAIGLNSQFMPDVGRS